MRLKGWVKSSSPVFYHDECFDLRPDASWSGTALLRRQKDFTSESLWYHDFIRCYRKRLRFYAKWLAMMSHAKKPSVQWDLDSLYEALLLWSTTDWPGVANVRVKVVAQSGQANSGADRSLARLPLTLQHWLDKAT